MSRYPATTLFDQSFHGSFDNIGLVYQKLLPLKATVGSEGTAEIIRQLAQRKAPSAYSAAFARWRAYTTPTDPGRQVAQVKSQGRLLLGLGEKAPSENGLTLHSVYGTPILPGSSLKGVARAWVHTHLSDQADWADPQEEGEPTGANIQALFGTGGHDGQAGAVDFLDALWVPLGQPWAAEIQTPHQGPYYQGDRPPDGMTAPVPITYLAAQGTFRLVIEGPESWAKLAMEILLRALQEHGIGSKTRVGYGRLTQVSDNLGDDRDVQAREERITAAKRKKLQDTLPALPVSERISFLAENVPVPKGACSFEEDLRRALRQKQPQHHGDWLSALDFEDLELLTSAVQHLQRVHQTKGLTKELSKLPKGARKEHLIQALSQRPPTPGLVPDTHSEGTDTEQPPPTQARSFGESKVNIKKETKVLAKLNKPNKPNKLKSLTAALVKLARRVHDGAYDAPSVNAVLTLLKDLGPGCSEPAKAEEWAAKLRERYPPLPER